MDPATLATTVLAVLTPYLVKAGGKLAEEVGGNLPENAAKLWAALTKKFKGKPAAEEAITDLAQKPDDEDNQAAVRKQIKKAVEEEPNLLPMLAELLENARREAAQNNSASGKGAVAINVGGHVRGNIVVGNNNSVKTVGDAED